MYAYTCTRQQSIDQEGRAKLQLLVDKVTDEELRVEKPPYGVDPKIGRDNVGSHSIRNRNFRPIPNVKLAEAFVKVLQINRR